MYSYLISSENVTNKFMWLSFLCQGLNLLDNNLTTSRLMKIIAAERLDPTNLTSCLDEEVLMCPH